MAESSMSTRRSQWKHYFKFCHEFDQVPLPASLETVLLYLAFMADRFKYVTIINYLSALWVLHKLSGFSHVDPKSFEIHVTLRGIRRTLGDATKQARPISVDELLKIYYILDLSVTEDLAFWCALLLCFRGLLRKSNVVEERLAVLVKDVSFFPWGVLLAVRRTKTISFKERVLELPFAWITDSPFCVATYLYRLISCLGLSPSAQLITYRSQHRLVRGTYSWLCNRIRKSVSQLRLESFTTHSLRRGGASAMADAGFSLIDIKNLGDWSSLSVLYYLTKTPQSKLDLDRRVSSALFHI